MHVLHITGSYGGTEVYKNLISYLDIMGVKQTVFVPLNFQNRERCGNQLINFKVKESKIIYDTTLDKRHKYLFELRIKTIISAIEKKIDLTNINIVHCANLCTDGAVAYELKKRYNIPYISAIRNTDLYTYYSLLIWKRPYFNNIVKNANKIMFISPAHRSLFIRKYLKLADIKSEVIPNGVDGIFLKNRYFHHGVLKKQINLIFASAYLQNKSLREIIQAISELRNETNLDLRLIAIGDGLPFRKINRRYINEIYNLEKLNSWLILESYVPKTELLLKYRDADIYIMPSNPETFGLVYVEALSQGLPIIYGSGQGFDGYFDNGFVGYRAQAFNVQDIKEAIKKTISNYSILIRNINNLNLDNLFSWKEIAAKYLNIYKENAK